jgi:hypothetical protein
MIKHTKEKLSEACSKVKTPMELAKLLNIDRVGKHIYGLIEKYKIDISHWTPLSGKKGQTTYTRLIGKKVHHFLVLEVIKKPQKNSKRFRYDIKCQCDCGNIDIYRTCYFKTITRCVKCDPTPRSNFNKTLYYELPIKCYHAIKQRAKSRGNEFTISKEYIWNLFLKQDKKCAITGVDIGFNINSDMHTASLDRIDSSKGYIEGNVQWVNKVINIMKQTMSTEDFLYMCRLVCKNENIDNDKVLNISQKFTQHMKNKKWRKEEFTNEVT